MMPIFSCCNSATIKLAKWISKEIEVLNITMGFELKNTEDLLQKLVKCNYVGQMYRPQYRVRDGQGLSFCVTDTSVSFNLLWYVRER